MQITKLWTKTSPLSFPSPDKERGQGERLLELLGHQRKGYAMPTYEYRCKKCGHRFDKFQNIKDLPEKVCPLCQGEVERLIGSGGGIIFKGSGFYITDYRSASYKKRAREESKTSSDTVKGKEKTRAGK